MRVEEAQSRMQEISRIMERTTLYTALPGTPAVIGGVLALAGCVGSMAMTGSADFQAVAELPVSAQVWFFIMWAVIGTAAVTQDVVLTRRAQVREGLAPGGRPGRFAALSLTPSVLVALVLTVKLAMDGNLRYVAPVWMMCYGTGVYAAGLFSVRLPRLLGLAFIVTGAAGLWFFADYGVALTAVSFGLLHVAFGTTVMAKSRQAHAVPSPAGEDN